MHEHRARRPELLAQLADRLQEGQALYVADRAADLDQHEVLAVQPRQHEFLDGVRDMRDDLHRRAQIVAGALAVEHPLVHLAGGHAVVAGGLIAGEPLVMAEVEVGFGAVGGHEHLAMLVGAHRAGIDIEVGVEFAHPHPVAARLQQCAERGGGEALAER